MNDKHKGYVILIACLGLLFVGISPYIKELPNWGAFFSPAFIGTLIFQMGSVIGAYIGGRITPINRDETLRTRSSDK